MATSASECDVISSFWGGGIGGPTVRLSSPGGNAGSNALIVGSKIRQNRVGSRPFLGGPGHRGPGRRRPRGGPPTGRPGPRGGLDGRSVPGGGRGGGGGMGGRSDGTLRSDDAPPPM